jgi:hypothetical protein
MLADFGEISFSVLLADLPTDCGNNLVEES